LPLFETKGQILGAAKFDLLFCLSSVVCQRLCLPPPLVFKKRSGKADEPPLTFGLYLLSCFGEDACGWRLGAAAASRSKAGTRPQKACIKFVSF